jgi:hypothetical protein
MGRTNVDKPIGTKSIGRTKPISGHELLPEPIGGHNLLADKTYQDKIYRDKTYRRTGRGWCDIRFD